MGRTSTWSAVALSTDPSGTWRHPGPSSEGSLATTVPAPSLRQHRVSPAAVAAIVVPSVSRRLNRPVVAAETSATTVASASGAAVPAASRSWTRAHSRAESTRASRLSSRVGGSPAARASTEGAAAASSGVVPGVAERTAASTAVLVVTRATSVKEASAHIGTALRYRAGTGSPGAYHPAPKPSAFMVPLRWRRGAQDWEVR
ncbi:hypothetical protein PLESTB_001908900 [Pleodorina starrii]|uniref:Uncharacterized protein n=1 Tax=Pleodorina starrii TaxID=330485 RepID=A0A9W6C2J0_9CHLO|nr:hypothetical protein PLESTB_001908900 [Pleodorina starrii]